MPMTKEEKLAFLARLNANLPKAPEAPPKKKSEEEIKKEQLLLIKRSKMLEHALDSEMKKILLRGGVVAKKYADHLVGIMKDKTKFSEIWQKANSLLRVMNDSRNQLRLPTDASLNLVARLNEIKDHCRDPLFKACTFRAFPKEQAQLLNDMKDSLSAVDRQISKINKEIGVLFASGKAGGARHVDLTEKWKVLKSLKRGLEDQFIRLENGSQNLAVFKKNCNNIIDQSYSKLNKFYDNVIPTFVRHFIERARQYLEKVCPAYKSPSTQSAQSCEVVKQALNALKKTDEPKSELSVDKPSSMSLKK